LAECLARELDPCRRINMDRITDDQREPIAVKIEDQKAIGDLVQKNRDCGTMLEKLKREAVKLKVRAEEAHEELWDAINEKYPEVRTGNWSLNTRDMVLEPQPEEITGSGGLSGLLEALKKAKRDLE